MNPSGSVIAELKRLIQQSSHYLTALVLSLALGFVSFPIYTRVFSVTDYGVIALVQQILLLAVAAGKLGQQNSALRFYDHKAFAADPGKARHYYSTLYFGVTGLSLVVTLLVLGGLPLVPAAWLKGPVGMVLAFTCLLILVRSLQSILWSFLRIEERTKLYNAMSVAIKAVTIVAIVGLLPVLGASVKTYYTGTMVVELLAVGALTIPILKKGMLSPASFDRTLFKAMLIFGAPLVVQELAGIVLESGDRLLVAGFLGDEALGYYSVAAGLSGYISTLMIAPLGLAIMPIYLRLWQTEGREKTIEFLSISFDAFLLVAAMVFAIAAAASHDAVILLASSKYKGVDTLMPILVAGLLFYATSYAFTTAGLVIQKQTGTLAMGLIYSAALKMALNFLLLPTMGLRGGAVASLISYIFCALYLGWVSFKVLPLRIHYGSLARYLLGSALGWAAATQVNLGFLASRIWVQAALNASAKAAVACVVYLVVVWVSDARLRDTVTRTWRHFRRKAEVGPGLNAVRSDAA